MMIRCGPVWGTGTGPGDLARALLVAPRSADAHAFLHAVLPSCSRHGCSLGTHGRLGGGAATGGEMKHRREQVVAGCHLLRALLLLVSELLYLFLVLSIHLLLLLQEGEEQQFFIIAATTYTGWRGT